MIAHERRRWLRDRVERHGFVRVDDAIRGTGASAATIRRDINALAGEGQIQRVHGGAVRIDRSRIELPHAVREVTDAAAKLAIAQTVAAQLGDADTVGLSGGSTMTAVAQSLPLTVRRVVTNSLAVANVVVTAGAAELVVVGGRLRPPSLELVGELAMAALSSLHVDVAIIGADGVDIHGGVTTHDDVEAMTNRALVQRSTRVLLAADGSKIGRTSFARICPVTDIDTLHTVAPVDDGALAMLEEAGLDVINSTVIDSA